MADGEGAAKPTGRKCDGRVTMATDDETFAALGAQLADDVELALPGWVRRCVERVALANQSSPPAGPAPAPDDLSRDAAEAGRRAVAEVIPELRALVALDVDQQRVNPLSLLRAAVRFPTEVLRTAGMAPVRRDEFAERAFPDDLYDLTPATFADIDPGLGEVGLVWGAAKAHVHLRRHKDRP
jgi:hypothetical protein